MPGQLMNLRAARHLTIIVIMMGLVSLNWGCVASDKSTIQQASAFDSGLKPATIYKRAAKIEIRQLSVSYAGRQVVRGVDRAIPATSIDAWIGPAGSGKASILRTINLLSIEVDGAQILSATAAADVKAEFLGRLTTRTEELINETADDADGQAALRAYLDVVRTAR